MVSQTGPRVVRSNFARGQIYPGKERKKAKGPATVIGDQSSQIWPQNGQPGNPDSDVQHCELYTGNIV